MKIMETEEFERLNDDLEKQRKQAIRVGKRGSTTFTIDISNYEYCAPKEARNIDGYRVFGYSPAMIVAEKLRAICQQMPSYATTVRMNPRARARDFVDITVIVDHFDIDFRADSFRKLLEHTFAAKKVPLQLLETIDQYREFHRAL